MTKSDKNVAFFGKKNVNIEIDQSLIQQLEELKSRKGVRCDPVIDKYAIIRYTQVDRDMIFTLHCME